MKTIDFAKLHKILKRALSLSEPEGKIYGVGHPHFYYREGERKAGILMESTLGDPRGDIVIYPASLMTWLPPHENELIPKEKKQHILRLLDHYLRVKIRVSYDILEEPEHEKEIERKVKNGEKIHKLDI